MVGPRPGSGRPWREWAVLGGAWARGARAPAPPAPPQPPCGACTATRSGPSPCWSWSLTAGKARRAEPGGAGGRGAGYAARRGRGRPRPAAAPRVRRRARASLRAAWGPRVHGRACGGWGAARELPRPRDGAGRGGARGGGVAGPVGVRRRGLRVCAAGPAAGAGAATRAGVWRGGRASECGRRRPRPRPVAGGPEADGPPSRGRGRETLGLCWAVCPRSQGVCRAEGPAQGLCAGGSGVLQAGPPGTEGG